MLALTQCGALDILQTAAIITGFAVVGGFIGFIVNLLFGGRNSNPVAATVTGAAVGASVGSGGAILDHFYGPGVQQRRLNQEPQTKPNEEEQN